MRLAIFARDGGLLVVALCVPERLRRAGRCCSPAPTRSCGPPTSRCSSLASRDDPGLRRAVVGLAVSTALGVGPAGRPRRSPTVPLQGALWALALAARHGRSLPVRRARLEADAQPLRRAPRADRDHRAGRVDRGHRRGRRAGRGRRRGGRGGARHRRRGRAVVAVLRRRRAGRRAPAVQRRRGRGAQPDRPRLLLLPALPDGGGDRAGGAGPEEDARATSTTR